MGIETDDGLDDVGELGRNLDAPLAASVLLVATGVHRELHLEGLAHRRSRPLEDDRPLRRALLEHLEPVLLGELRDLVEVGGIGAVLLRELGPAQDVALRERRRRELVQ